MDALHNKSLQRLTISPHSWWFCPRNAHDELRAHTHFTPQLDSCKQNVLYSLHWSTILPSVFHTTCWSLQSVLCHLSTTFLHKSCSRTWPWSRMAIAACSGICPRKHKNGPCFKADESMQWEHTGNNQFSLLKQQTLKFMEAEAHFSAEHISFSDSYLTNETRNQLCVVSTV